MLFNSFEFFIFFPVVTALFYLMPHRFRWLHLLAASCLFYMAFLPVYVFILVVTIVVDYFAGLYIENSSGKRRKLYLVLSLVVNIGFLCFFKYFDFVVDNINSLLAIHIPQLKDLWISARITSWNNFVNTHLNQLFGTDLKILETIVLPIGLSFHTFQAMSYTIEVYKGRQKAERHFGIYALYVMFYPQLVAGPIERPQHVLHQFHERKYFKAENLVVGLRLMAWGLFKKVVIADRLAVYVNLVYHDPVQYHWLNVALATLFFAIQIYCDFSGYSDMAIGAAKTMGYDLMINFRRPYFATNIREFWEKWHISLSSWFRDYLYIPIGGNRARAGRVLFNVAVVFIISGIWHGANWTFVVWGALHAAYSITYMLWDKYAKKRKIDRTVWYWQLSGWLVTMTAVCGAWIFFRARDLRQSIDVIRQIVFQEAPAPFKFILLEADGKGGFGYISMLIILLAGIYLFFIEHKNQPLLTGFNGKPFKDVVFITLTCTAIIVLGLFINKSFIYFQF